jgi:hypothetical protein
MKVCFIAKRKKICFVARPSKKKCPKHLKKFLFKPGTKRLRTTLVKARKGWKAWRRSR